MNKIAGLAGAHIIGNYFTVRAVSFRSVDNYIATVIRATYICICISNDSGSYRDDGTRPLVDRELRVA